MNAPHWHLVLNHLPVVGMLFGTGLLAFAVGRKSEELMRTALGFLVIVALTAVPVFLTGEPAEIAIMEAPDFQEALAKAHEQAATMAFVSVLLVGAVALAVLLVFRRAPVLPRWLKWVVLGLALAATALLGRAANLGGMIRHPEIRAAADAVAG